MTAVSTCPLPARRGALVPPPLGCAVTPPADGACWTVLPAPSRSLLPGTAAVQPGLQTRGLPPSPVDAALSRSCSCAGRLSRDTWRGGATSKSGSRVRGLSHGGGRGPAAAAPALAAGDLRLGRGLPASPHRHDRKATQSMCNGGNDRSQGDWVKCPHGPHCGGHGAKAEKCFARREFSECLLSKATGGS